MRHMLLALALGVALSTAASAAPITLTMQEALSLFNALGALEGKDTIVGEGDKAKVVKEPYSFSAGVRLGIAKNMLKVKEVVDTFNTARTGLLQEIAGPAGKIDPGTPEATKFTEQVLALLKEEQTVDLVTMKAEDLDLKTNAIPAAVLVWLSPMITDFDTASVPDAAPPEKPEPPKDEAKKN